MTTPLTVLDLIPISSGSTAAQALRNSIDLARQAESLGYTRYWFAEHHLNPGVAGTSPAVVLALTAAARERRRFRLARAAGAAEAEVEAAGIGRVEQAELLDGRQRGAVPHLHRARPEPDG